MQLLDIFLPLMNEEQLRRNILESLRFASLLIRSLVFVLLDREIPERDLVVRSRGGETGIFRRMPFDRRYRCGVPVECGYGRRCWCFRSAQSRIVSKRSR